MGNTILTPQASSQILNKYWEPIDPSTYRNKATQEIIKQKKMTFRTQEEMKYVFNCLLKRMNNYNSNVIKIVYLRKIAENNSICDCGKKFTILVYVENVEFRLKNFIASHNDMILSKSQQLTLNSYNHKCICLHMLKGAQYLKQRYGAFKVTKNNCWIQLPKKTHYSSTVNKQYFSAQSKSEYVQNVKVKLWISCEEEQNFPDQSCQEKQMCLSIIQLIQHTLIPSRLCKCYSSVQLLDKYLTVHRLKELAQIIKYDHQPQKELITQAKPLQNSQVIKQQLPFQRTIRSFSSNQPGHHPTYYPHSTYQRGQQTYQQVPQRKYTSIEYVRKPIEEYSIATDKKAPRTPLILSQANHIVSQPSKPYANQQQPKHSSFQLIKHQQNSFKNDYSLTKNENKAANIFYETQKPLKIQRNNGNIQPLKNVQVFNPKIKYRHGNTAYQRPIIGIADMSAQLNNHQVPIIVMPNIQQATKTEHKQSPQIANQLLTDRDNQTLNESVQGQPIGDISKINLKSDTGKKQVQTSLDKGTNPTDRTKFQVSSKGQSKKQGQAINSSRKNISIIPISLQSTYTTGSPIKPILHSYDHLHKPVSTPVQPDFQIPIKNQSNHMEHKSKKESASSSKSQRNYTAYQINLTNISNKQGGPKFIPKKRMSDQEPSGGQSSQRKPQDNEPLREKAHSFVNKIETLGLTTQNGDMCRLRQSEYIMSAQNSFRNSKQMSRKQSNELLQILSPEKPITSLAEMQAQFPTLNDIANIQTLKFKKSQSHFVNQHRQQMASQINRSSSQRSQFEQLIQTERKQNYHPIVSKQSSKSQSQSSYQPQNQRVSIAIEKRPHISNLSSDKVSSLIVRQQQEPLNVPKSQEEQRTNMKLHQNYSTQKIHHQKHLSNPTFEKNYMSKNKSLKEQFSSLLDFPKQNSFKALTENKQKLLTLDQKEGRQTYSIYNESEYNASEKISKGQSQRQIMMGTGNPPLPHKQTGKHSKWRKPFSKHELQKEMQQKKQASKAVHLQQNQQILRLTSSGHEDNSIKQKVRNKKAEFAELKNQMNSLLL